MPPSRNVHIAVVDDDDSFREATVFLVKSLGYDVAGYESAESFLYMRPDRDADCIISDINMLGMSGIELKERLNAEGCVIPVIFVSAQMDAILPRRATECGGLTLLQKPFSEQSLINAMVQALGDRSLD